jgi:hypothetical protein
MDYQIKAIVDRYPNLRIQVNKGERHRIMHRRIDRGSLWLGSRRAGEYGVLANGDVKHILHDLLNCYVDPAIGTDYDAYVIRRKGVVIPNINELAKIIGRLGAWH